MRCRSLLSCALPAAAWISGACFSLPACAESDIEFSLAGRIAVENRWYPETNLFPGQSRHATGFVLEPEFYFEGPEGWGFSLVPFLRYDSADGRRTHADLREAYFLAFGDVGEGEWELRLGVDRVFWGVIESNHLVDIVNQVDAIEHPDGEAELGQLMAHLTWSGEWGVAELFLMPYHRERTFASHDGRLRSAFVVDEDHPTYESSAEQWHTDIALRYSHSFGPFDLGVSVFDGTSRDPVLRPRIRPDGVALIPHYEQIRQYGLDLQMTTDAWLLKLEAIHRSGAQNLVLEEDDYFALAAGFEYTFYAAFDSPADLGVLAEWSYDERGDHATRAFDDDLFFGVRYTFNDVQDTNLLVGALQDRQHSSLTIAVEMSRRMTDQWSMNIEALLVADADDRDVHIHPIRRDSFFELGLNYNF